MAFWRRERGSGARRSIAGGDAEVEALLETGLELGRLQELLAARAGDPEPRAVLVHAVGLDDRLDDVLRAADGDDPVVRLLRAVRTHDLAWASRGRAVTSLTREDRFVDFHGALAAAEEQLDVLSLELPEDEVPLWYLVSCARGLERGHQVALERLDRLRAIARTHRRGHSHALRYLSPKWGGAEDLVTRFSWQLSESNPAGSVLHGMVPESIVETWTSRLAGAGDPDRGSAELLWQDQRVRDQLDLSWAAFTGGDDPAAPWRVRDLNTFLFCFSSAAMHDHLAAAAELLDGRVSDYPWRYVADDDVTEPFERAVAHLR
jgi:hypothetical protein